MELGSESISGEVISLVLRRLRATCAKQLRERWPARIRVGLVAATVQRTLDLRGRGAVLQVYEGGRFDVELATDLPEALGR